MNWSVHPAKKNIKKTFIALIFIAFFMVAVGFIYGIFWAILGLLILFFSLHSYFFPTRYEITEDKIIINNILGFQKRTLSEFKKVYKGKNGLLLSPFRGRTFLNNFRGVFLLMPEERASIEEFLITRVKEINNITENEQQDINGKSASK
ncbi:hypothetical protein A2Y85_02540 [candidate division WOR-3 bacterium RBG_13_43_14]|uniref:PH domain-containing protein n=1 Tax=candidate division WOR-3 bacterium RBG_13_43_14 TaxID=1802590 RepID=A0A1F4U927_UNCW3|nr:MAG: hypothetical protein A2Y85_02540 [candidate division WOR-3 bacterium RBG_13_43_14]